MIKNPKEMTNPIQLLRDFRKWRRERYDEVLKSVLKEKVKADYGTDEDDVQFAYYLGLLNGITDRKEILKQVKI